MISRGAAATLSLGLAAASLLGVGPATAHAPVARAAAHAVMPRTELTFAVQGCNGCHFRLTQALDGRRRVWQSPQHTVRNGSVTWTVPTRRTHGLSVTVLAPWDGGAGYVPTVAFRYGGTRPGDHVSKTLARTKRRASTCWAGTTKDAVTLRITVAHARSTNPPGDPIRTPRAFTSTTQRWEKPMERAYRGITGTQEASYCG